MITINSDLKKNLCMVNVASSHYCVKGFINYDNHIFLRLINFPSLFYLIFPRKYHEIFSKFVTASTLFDLKRWNCKKPLPHNETSIDHILCSNFLEHVYESEAIKIVKDFYVKLKPGATLHILLPDLSFYVDQYSQQKQNMGYEHLASDVLNFDTILTVKSPPSFKFKLMELIGSFGLKHLRMYDAASANFMFQSCGFISIPLNQDCPSFGYLANTPDNLHLLFKKPG